MSSIESSKISQEERERLALLSILEDERQARFVLKQQEERYRTLVESLNDGLIQVDNEDKVLFVNNRFCQMTGYKPEELLGRVGYEILFDAEDWKTIKKKNQERLSGVNDRYEIKVKHKKGISLWVRVSSAPVYDAEGKVIGSLGLFADISQEKEARSRAEALEHRYRLFINSTQDLAFLKDSDLRYLMVNEANEKYFGRPLEEILGRTDFDLMPKEQAEACRRSDRQALEEKRRVIGEEEVEGTIYETRKFPVVLEDGRVGVGGIIRDITDRRRYEQLLLESSKNWRVTFDAIKDGVCLLSADQKALRCNQAFAQFAGKGFREIIGRYCYELVHPQGAPPEACPFARMKKSRQRESMEMSINGRTFDVLVDPIIDEKGEISGAVHILSEITERKKTERELQESEERFRTFFENTFVGIYRATPDGRILMANPALLKMLGYRDFADLSRRNLEEEGYEPGYSREEFKRMMAQANQVIGYEAPWQRKDGSVIWVRENARCVRDEKGEVLYYEGTVEDITDRRLAERARRESEEKYRMLVESLNDVIFSTSLDDEITYISPVVEKLSEYKTHELIGHNFLEFIHPDDRAELQTKIERTLKGIIEPSVFRVVDKGGRIKYFRGSSRPVIKDGQVIGLSGIMSDVTHQVELEEEKKLIEEELRQSQKLEAIGQLAGGVAHDFNNMLAGILGSAEMLLKRLADRPELARLVENIISGAEHAAGLTKNLLAFSRKQPKKIESLDMNRLIEETIGVLSKTMDRRIKLEKQTEGERMLVNGDRSSLANVLLNLGLNARDAMLQGGRLTYRCQRTYLDQVFIQNHGMSLKPGEYVRLEVSDTGCGMTPEVKSKMFEPFFTTKEPGKGTGLGLAMVYGTIREHNGHIDCYSEPGRGTAMKIYLPFYQGELKQPEQETKIIPASRQATILILDDEEMVRGITDQILSTAGYQVLSCGDAEQAVELYQQRWQKIDLVILDMIMPKMSGREVFLRLKEINPKIKAMLASGFSEDEEINQIRKLGISDFIQKPFHVKDLIEKVGILLA